MIAVKGSYPGPSVVIEKGQTFTANFVNNLTRNIIFTRSLSLLN
ncbi:MAG: multicopper oxidase domain-containing protein [Bacteroidota bacterium]